MIGKRLYDLRKELGFTQAKLSELCDISREQINRYENDKAVPDFGTVVKLAKVFNVSVNSILSGPESDKIVTDEDIRLALSSNGNPLTVREFEEVRQFAAFIQERNNVASETTASNQKEGRQV